MLEALWSMRVHVNSAPVNAGGVVIIENGRIFGGDSSFIWTGTVHIKDEIATARVHVKKYQDVPGMTSITGLNDYMATFRGQVNHDRMTLVGSPDTAPQAQLHIEMIRRAELP